MASNNTVAPSQQQQLQQQQQQQQHFQQPNSQHHCKECGLFFDSSKSLEVHLQYHKENLLNKWATQASQNAPGATDEANNNSTKSNNNKREFSANTIAAAADSSDAMLKGPAAAAGGSNKSPDSYGSRTTPETSTSFGHPPTPQSYSSAPSPYQGGDAGAAASAAFSPGYQGYAPIKTERAPSPLYQYPPAAQHHHLYGSDTGQYFGMEGHQQPQLTYPQDYPVHKVPSQSATFRYHPYHAYERSSHVSSSSPAYPSQNPQPTPSPSPKQCDKCGYVCDSAAQLIDHINHAHPPTPAPHLASYQQHQHQQQQHQQQQQHFQFAGMEKAVVIKTEEEPQTEILDLDSHKVHQVFQSPEEEESLKRHNGELANLNGPHPHSVSAMLAGWPGGSPHQKMFASGAVPPSPTDHRMFLAEHKMYPANIADSKMFQSEQKLFQPHQIHAGDFVSNGVTTTSQESGGGGGGAYRPFEHMAPQPAASVISSSAPPATAPTGPSSKGANWKSNEARRPKTYNCSACNKWFTSSGHLKRHYNTTLHKNAVKSSGQPDPATMPISAHHHPGREPVGARPPDPGAGAAAAGHSPGGSADALDDGRGEDAFERGLLQQPPSGPYDRPAQHSPHATTNPLSSAGSPPNGDAGPSVTNHHDHSSRGLLSISTPSTPQQQVTSLSPMVASMSTATSQHQLSPAPFSIASHSHISSTSSSSSNNSTHMMGMGPGSPADSLHPQHQPPHHHQHQQQQLFQSMSPASSMPASYPNGLAPHVTPVTATSSPQQALISLITTGEPAVAAEFTQYGLSSQQYHHHQHQQLVVGQMTGEHQPLPSFAQFQPHRYGLLLAAAAGYSGHEANVGGLAPVTESPHHHHHHHHNHQHMSNTPHHILHIHHQQQQQYYATATALSSPASPRGLLFHGSDDDYELTALEGGDTVLPDDNSQTLPYSPPMELVAVPASPPPAAAPVAAAIAATRPPPGSPRRDELKRDYETGSPRITSTGSPLAGKTAPVGVHKCFDCDKVFNKACYLTQHNKTFHCGDKPFKCGRCGKRFPSDDSYQEHLAKHAGDKPYKCELCPKQFNHKTDLRRHMCLHTGQKPYACDHCGKGFIRKDHMLKHAETHARKTLSAKHHHQPQLQPASSSS